MWAEDGRIKSRKGREEECWDGYVEIIVWKWCGNSSLSIDALHAVHCAVSYRAALCVRDVVSSRHANMKHEEEAARHARRCRMMCHLFTSVLRYLFLSNDYFYCRWDGFAVRIHNPYRQNTYLPPFLDTFGSHSVIILSHRDVGSLFLWSTIWFAIRKNTTIVKWGEWLWEEVFRFQATVSKKWEIPTWRLYKYVRRN